VCGLLLEEGLLQRADEDGSGGGVEGSAPPSSSSSLRGGRGGFAGSVFANERRTYVATPTGERHDGVDGGGGSCGAGMRRVMSLGALSTTSVADVEGGGALSGGGGGGLGRLDPTDLLQVI